MSVFFRADDALSPEVRDVIVAIKKIPSPMSMNINVVGIAMAREFQVILQGIEPSHDHLTQIATCIMDPNFSDGYIPRGAYLEMLAAKGLDIESFPRVTMGAEGTSAEGRVYIDGMAPRGIKLKSAEEDDLKELKKNVGPRCQRVRGASL